MPSTTSPTERPTLSAWDVHVPLYPEDPRPAVQAWLGHVAAGRIGAAPASSPAQAARHARNEALLLGPLAVDAAHEGRGIGAALMRAAIAQAQHRGHGAILLVGDAAYYERFGFFAQKTAHLVMPGPFQRERLLALELKSGWLEGAAGMIVASGRKLG